MSGHAWDFEADGRARSAKFMTLSVILHVLFFVILAQVTPPLEEAYALTEITWIESVEAAPPVAPEPLTITQPVVAPKPVKRKEKVVPVPLPETRVAALDPAPRPQKLVRSEPLRRATPVVQTTIDRPVRSAVPIAVKPDARPRAATAAAPSEAAKPTALSRSEAPVSRAPVELSRSQPQPTRTSVQMPAPERPTSAPMAEPDENTPKRDLAGASLVGPVADRNLLSYGKPVYPDWAKRDAVEASVTIRFIVIPDGRVKRSVQILKTSGFEEFDRNAINALLSWRFSPLPPGTVGDQWGQVTFHYRLRDEGRS